MTENTMNVKTVRELMEMLKNLNPNTELRCFDSRLGYSTMKISVEKFFGEETVFFEAD